MEDCIVYLVWQLRQAKFEVRFTWPNMLFISWKHHEGEYLSHQNPIVQAMTPEPPPRLDPPLPRASGGRGKKAAAAGPAPPSKPTVAFNQDIELLINPSFQGSAFGATPINPTPRRAADYQPPAAFLQTMDRPGPGRQKEYKEGAKGNVLADLWAFN